MAKRGRKKQKKQKQVSLEVEVVGLIVISVLLAVLIYMKSGFIGEHLSPMLGGILGFIKYIIPVGTFTIAIYLACKKYTLFLMCIAVILSVFQISAGNINISKDITNIVEQAYYLGARDIGGGVLGTIIAVPLINMLGSLGTVILSIGMSIVSIVFIFAIKPTEIIANTVEGIEERREERRTKREKNINKVQAKGEIPKKETARERRLREREEEKRRAMEIDENQITINLSGLDENNGKLKKYKYEKDDLQHLYGSI